MSQYLDLPAPIGLAHRGGWPADASGRIRPELENTELAFQHAIDLGYRYLETDVHTTRDGALLAFHDSTLDRATDRTGTIGELPYAEVAEARVGGQEPIPLLEDLLGNWPGARFNIDLKADGSLDPLLRTLRRTRAWHRVCVGSFSQRRLDRARRLFERPVATSCGPVDVARLRLASVARVLRPMARRGVTCVQIPLRSHGVPLVTRDVLTTAHALGMQVHVWTINDPALMRRLLDAGVDGIVSDDVYALRRVLSQYGAWEGGEFPGKGNGPEPGSPDTRGTSGPSPAPGSTEQQ
ncbi:glycerophosphodiester phosphodiesterase [Haloactinospora alba]|uniref:glycerophosphodiester phosphodiesterase n=1 Tax=Haloactinospora alba TaxID=405555 RepID=UPI001FEC130D|nr:glycerophosphodiester phosphodiesterase [Haloactinospora alba]